MSRTDQRTTINQLMQLANELKPRAVVDVVLKLAETLNSDQLDELQIQLEALRVQALLEEQTPYAIVEPPTPQLDEEEGFIEKKYINGCGPYLYRRYRTPDGKQKSQYLGKAKK